MNFSRAMMCKWYTCTQERRRQKLLAFQELAERLEDERKMMDYRRQQIEERKEFQEREAAQKVYLLRV